MKKEQVKIVALTIFATFVLSSCANNTDTAETGTRQSPIVGGEEASSSRYDPVGALVQVMDDGALVPICTGALTAPNVVTTAKHCLLATHPDQELAFAIGVDARDPDLLVPVVERVWERDVTGGILGLGSDVAVVILEEPIWDIMPVLIWPATAHGLGRDYEIVGFGVQDFFWNDPSAPDGTRMRGTAELAGLGPMPYWQVVYNNDFDAYFGDYTSDLPSDQADDPGTLEGALDHWENMLLLEDYDVVFARVTANSATGDSGGPVMSKFFGLWISRGVVSGFRSEEGDQDWTVPSNTAVYANFGPEAAHLVRSAPICQGIPEEGRCDGDEVLRCSNRHEGWFPHVIEEECNDTCVDAPGGAQCAPECTEDADCDAVVPNGMCVDGRCEWSLLEHCRAESTAPSCFLCCMLQATEMDFNLCLATCYAPPPATSTRSVARFASFPDLEVPLD